VDGIDYFFDDFLKEIKFNFLLSFTKTEINIKNENAQISQPICVAIANNNPVK
jgi:hypothetical protein